MDIPDKLHRHLKRQLQKATDDTGEVNLNKFIELINQVYHDNDGEQFIAHQSILAMSQELNEKNEALHHKAEHLKESEERYALATRGANDGLWDWYIFQNKCFFSERWKEMIGFSADDDFPDLESWLSRIHPNQHKVVKAALYKHLDGHTERFEAEYQIQTKAGDYRWVLTRGIAARDKSNQAIRIAGSQTDISQRKKYEDQLFKAAFHDKLTGLPNRALFMDRLKQLVKSFKRPDSRRKNAALFFLDLDRFKVINDSLGHEAGDQLLISVAGRLEMNLRPDDTICRLGGDEFTILLHEINGEEHARLIADRMIEEIKKPYFIMGQQVFMSGSIGIVIIDKAQEPESILRNADLAMYQAKNGGKSCAEIFNQSHYDLIYSTLQVETDLRLAIEREEFTLFYQPILNLKTGRVDGLEALVRWQHPKKGIVPPMKFIPIAEETGLILPLGEYIIKKVCEQLKFWANTFGYSWSPSVAVNLSTKQLLNHQHFRRILKICQDTKLRTDLIKFEVTESSIMENLEQMAPRLATLKSEGFELAIDDFGT